MERGVIYSMICLGEWEYWAVEAVPEVQIDIPRIDDGEVFQR